jgi:thymidylate kinase
MNFQSVVFEGGDQVGKGDASNTFTNNLMKENVDIKRLAFPMYSTPIGSVIRKFLKEGVSQIDSFKNIVGTRRELEIRMMIYALNRLEALESILRHSEDFNGIYVFDRSPYSNALTISYGLGGLKNITKDDVKSLVRLGYDSEELLIKTLNLENCVIHLKSDNGIDGWKASRLDDADLLESKDVQEVADFVYSEFEKLVGDGWNTVLTKIDGKWRGREDIFKDINTFVKNRIDIKKGDGCIKIYDSLDVCKDLYGVDIGNLDNYSKYVKAIEECDKDTMYREALEVARYITERCEEVSIYNEEVLKNMRSILDSYPEILDLLEYYLGKYFVENLKASIYE